MSNFVQNVPPGFESSNKIIENIKFVLNYVGYRIQGMDTTEELLRVRIAQEYLMFYLWLLTQNDQELSIFLLNFQSEAKKNSAELVL